MNGKELPRQRNRKKNCDKGIEFEREREQRSGGGEKKLRKQRTRERQERQWEDEWKKKKRESNILITSPHIYLNKKKRENLREENKRKGKVERRGK